MNFLVRTREAWAAQGFALLIPDAPGGNSLYGRRHLPAYAEAIAAAIDFGRAHANLPASLPIWLVGTSQGSTAAANGAAHLGTKVSGVVLTSSVTRPNDSGETVFDSEPGAIAVPALVVGNRNDLCDVTPPDDIPKILAALPRAPKKESMLFESSQIAYRAPLCEAMTPHGYFGIENSVVQRIADWIRAAGGR
jgi:hypothetical protein